MAWNLALKSSRSGFLTEDAVEQAPLSRFAPKHQREMPLPEPVEVEEVVNEAPIYLRRDAPQTPLNQMIYSAANNTAVQAKSEPVAKPAPEASYLTGLEEEPPITISILKRALPERF